MKAVILAAGEGKRLRPLTSFKPKVLLPVGGKPLLDHILSALKLTNVKEVLIIVKYMKDQIIENYNTFEAPFKIGFQEQKEFLGTANAIGVSEDFIGDDACIVINGDIVTHPTEIKNIIDFHIENYALCTLGVKQVENPYTYGVVETKHNPVLKIIEKPDPTKTKLNLVSVGIMCFSPKVFELIKQTPISPRNEYEITKTIELAISKNMKVVPFELESWWMDIGKPWDFLYANEILLSELKPKQEGVVEEGATIKGPVSICKNAIIRSGAYIVGPVLIDEGADIGPNCYIRASTYIGKNCRIGNACEIKNSIIQDETHIGHLSYVGDSIIGEKVNFGAGTIIANLRFDDKPVYMNIKGKKTSSGRRKLGAIIGDYAKTGIGVNILPGVKVGAKSFICPNVTLWIDIEDNKIVNTSKIEYEIKDNKRFD
ncbi:MAG: bifunctional sugar-1-phosphate nucleotidylyltransferase/acetyltransferase [Candidatus Odinarchaeia archaeon]